MRWSLFPLLLPIALGAQGHVTQASPSPWAVGVTGSVALDRIDQRVLPLDGRLTRRGTGRGVTVYVMDGGVWSQHPEVRGRVRTGYHHYAADSLPCNTHGTAVAGAAAGRSLGVAPEADIVSVGIIKCGVTRGTIASIVAGSDWIVADHRAHGGPAVVNWSFVADTSQSVPAVDSAVARLEAAGMLVVVSAGNVDQNACHISPANAPGVLAVGASSLRHLLDRDVDRRAPATAWGPCVALYAPGLDVPLPDRTPDGQWSTSQWQGTSVAAGYVSGAAALLLEADPALTPTALADRLRRAATPGVVAGPFGNAGALLYIGR